MDCWGVVGGSFNCMADGEGEEVEWEMVFLVHFLYILLLL
jgi:hypothetical protein